MRCAGSSFSACASRSRSIAAYTTAINPSDAQYRYAFCAMKPVSAAANSIRIASLAPAMRRVSAT